MPHVTFDHIDEKTILLFVAIVLFSVRFTLVDIVPRLKKKTRPHQSPASRVAMSAKPSIRLEN